MPLPSVLPTSLPARPGHKSHQFPGWDDPGALELRPPSQNLPQTKVTAASWEWDHYWKERRVFGVFSKKYIHAGIPGCVIYFHPITSKSLDPGLPIFRPLSFHTGLWWKSLAWLLMQKALHKNFIFNRLCLQPPTKFVVPFTCLKMDQKVSNSRGGDVATHLSQVLV